MIPCVPKMAIANGLMYNRGGNYCNVKISKSSLGYLADGLVA